MYSEYLKYGHTIGNHTYSHNYSAGGVYSSADSFIKSIRKQDKFTEKATGGYKPVIVRFPGGSGTAGSVLGDIKKELRKEGDGWIDWTVDSSDSWGADNTSPKIIMKQIKKAAKDQKIMVILFHEWSENSEKAMPQVIEYLEDQGYIFLPLFYDSVMVEK
jgi:peptidoglycan/xylan/chitin deacetylase (PgdA/CDA1 family)